MPRHAAWIDRVPIGMPTYHPISSAVVLPLLIVVPLLIVLLAVRRATGALVQPLPTTGLFACGLLLAIWAVAAHLWLASRSTGWQASAAGSWRNPSVWLPPAVLLLACYGLLLPGSSAGGLVGLIAVLGLSESAAWGLRRRDQRSGPRLAVAPPIAGLPIAGLPPTKPNVGVAPPAEDFAEEVIAETARHRDSEGREAIRGWVQVELQSGQRTVPVHVAFCPALAGRPSCEAEQVDGPPASIRVAQVLPYGARFDVKLETPAAEPVSVRIEFAATASVSAERSD